MCVGDAIGVGDICGGGGLLDDKATVLACGTDKPG